MSFKLLATVSSTALLISVAPVAAATFTFDSFDTDQAVYDEPQTGGSNTSTVTSSAGDIFGGSRTMTVENTYTEGDPELATSLVAANGFLSFNNVASATGKGTLTYDGNGSGLGNMVLGPQMAFVFDVREFDNDGDVDFSLDAEDGSGNTVSYTENLQTGFSPRLTFAELAGGDPFDFTDVASLTFTVSTTGHTPSIDGSLNGITLSAVPLPASALLLFGGLGGLAALRRRRKE